MAALSILSTLHMSILSFLRSVSVHTVASVDYALVCTVLSVDNSHNISTIPSVDNAHNYTIHSVDSTQVYAVLSAFCTCLHCCIL